MEDSYGRKPIGRKLEAGQVVLVWRRGECGTCHYAKWANEYPESGPREIACLRYPPAVCVDPQRHGERIFFLMPRMPPDWWCGEYVPSDTGRPIAGNRSAGGA